MMNERTTFVLALFITIVSFSSCKNFGCYKLKGPITEWDYGIAPFSKIKVFNSPNIYVSQKETQTVRVEAEENMFQAILFHIDPFKELFMIDYDEVCVYDVDYFNIYIELEQFRGAELVGDANVYVADTLVVSKFTAALQSSGSVNLSKLKSDSLSTVIEGTGGVNITGLDTIAYTEVELASSGGFHGFDATSKVANVRLTGSGNVEVSVTDTLVVTILGSGNVRYKGNPYLVQDITGSGQLIDAN